MNTTTPNYTQTHSIHPANFKPSQPWTIMFRIQTKYEHDPSIITAPIHSQYFPGLSQTLTAMDYGLWTMDYEQPIYEP